MLACKTVSIRRESLICEDFILWLELVLASMMQVYQEKGLKDKERYKSEMLEYKSSYDSTVQ